MAADAATHQAIMRKPVQTALATIAWRRREDERQVARMSGREKAPLERQNELFRRSHANEA